jgi:hypothetical protein
LEQELASVIRFCLNQEPFKKFYTKRMKEGFEYPSLYCPPPQMVGGQDTLSSYLKTYLWPIKVFDKDSEKAVQKAENIANKIMALRFYIPLVDPDGQETGDFLRFKRVEAKEIDDGVAQILLSWDSRYLFERQTYEKMQSLYLFFEMKMKG